MLTELLIIVALILVNGFFAGAEIALVGIRPTRLNELIGAGSRSARAAAALRGQPERFLATTQIGMTVVGATAAAFGGATLAAQLAVPIAHIPIVGRYAYGIALALVVAGISYLTIVLGELIPKSLALRSAERFALIAARPLVVLGRVGRPLIWLLTRSSNLVLRPFGDQTTFTEARHSPEELQALLGEAARAGTVDRRAGEIATRAIQFGETKVSAVMVPRQGIVAVAKNASADDLRHIALEEGHARMPVYEGSLDNIVGYMTVRDVLALAWEGKLIVPADLVRPAHFVPEMTPAAQVLQELQQRHSHMAIVVDEHGAVAGIVTLEDLIEELVGEIYSEHTVPLELLHRAADGSAVAAGELPVRNANRDLDLELPESESYSTMAGLCLTLAGRIPEKGARFEVADAVIEVLEATSQRVRIVRISRRSAGKAGD
jgi:putative hemolysin